MGDTPVSSCSVVHMDGAPSLKDFRGVCTPGLSL